MHLFAAQTSPVSVTAAALQTRLPPAPDHSGDRLRKAYAGRGSRRLLVVFQAVNAAGKDGAIAEIGEVLGPNAVRTERFRPSPVPTADRDLLAEAARLLPRPAEVVLFNRSYYEAPLAAAGQGAATVADLCGRIVAFEAGLGQAGTSIRKLFLHVDKQVQLERLGERLRRPELRALHKPADYEDQRRWDDLMRAYDEVMTRTHTDAAPWFVVPGNDRAVRNAVVQQILSEALEVTTCDPPGR